MSDLLQPHGLQHTRHLCPSPSPRVCSDSCPLSQWCYPTILSSVVPFSSCLQSLPASESLHQVAKVLEDFSITPSNEYSGLIFFRIDWFDLLAVQGTLKSLLQHCSSKESIIWCSAFFMIQLSHLYKTAAAKSPQSCPTLCDPIDRSPPGSPIPGILQATGKKKTHSFDYVDLCWQSDISAF